MSTFNTKLNSWKSHFLYSHIQEKEILQRHFFRLEEMGFPGAASETQEGPQTERSHEWWRAWQILTVDLDTSAYLPPSVYLLGFC